MRENVTNFASTTLATPSFMGTSGVTTFTVATGFGVLFPTSNFVICMDTELMFISSRSSDTFIIQTRGFDSTVVTSHTTGSVITLIFCRYNFDHIWSNIADTYNPLVPPVQLSGTPSIYDNEFESVESWTLAPGSPGSGTTWSINSAMTSQLVFNRGNNDFALYTAYIPFTLTGAFTITARVSDATGINHTGLSDQAQTNFFVSDQSNPTGSADGGTRFRIDVVNTSDVKRLNNSFSRWVRTAKDVTGTGYVSLNTDTPVAYGQSLWLRITYNGNGVWNGMFGDGYSYAQLGGVTNFLRAPATLGFSFSLFNPSGQWQGHTSVIDYIRVVSDSVLPTYGG